MSGIQKYFLLLLFLPMTIWNPAAAKNPIYLWTGKEWKISLPRPFVWWQKLRPSSWSLDQQPTSFLSKVQSFRMSAKLGIVNYKRAPVLWSTIKSGAPSIVSTSAWWRFSLYHYVWLNITHHIYTSGPRPNLGWISTHLGICFGLTFQPNTNPFWATVSVFLTYSESLFGLIWTQL